MKREEMEENKNSTDKEGPLLIAKSNGKKSPSLRFGWKKFRPECLQILNGPKSFLCVLILVTFCQATANLGLTGLTLPSIEKRFSLTSKQLGVIMASNDVTALFFVTFISYYGDYWNKIRWIGGGGVIFGFSVLLYALPHFIIGPYQPSLTGPRGPACFSGNVTGNQPQCSLESDSRWYYMAIFVLAQLIMGIGGSPYFSLLPAYLDENVHPKDLPIYLGVWSLANSLGPGIGMLIGGKLLSIYVDLKQPEGVTLTAGDPRWIGAWWLGFVIFGILTSVFSFLLLGFPRELPGAREMREEQIKNGNIRKATKAGKPTLKMLLPELKDILTNWTFLFNTLAQVTVMWYYGAMLPFYPKILLLKFGVTSEQIGYVLGAALTPSMGVGIIIGSMILRRFPLKDVCKKAALVMLILRALGFLSPLSFLMPGCNNNNLAGVTTPYNDTKEICSSTIALSLTSTCNKNCRCSQSRFAPVCGSDNITYFDMCHAGCKVRFPNKTFANCSCIPSSSSGSEIGTAILGMCDRDCKNFVFFMSLLALHFTIQFAKLVPDRTITLRCVPDNKRAFAYGLKYVAIKTLGFFPAPIIFGHVVDSYCILWQDTCGVKGRCFDYDVEKLSYAICVYGTIIMCVATLFYFLSWHLYKPEERSTYEDREALQNDNETKL